MSITIISGLKCKAPDRSEGRGVRGTSARTAPRFYISSSLPPGNNRGQEKRAEPNQKCNKNSFPSGKIQVSCQRQRRCRHTQCTISSHMIGPDRFVASLLGVASLFLFHVPLPVISSERFSAGTPAAQTLSSRVGVTSEISTFRTWLVQRAMSASRG